MSECLKTIIHLSEGGNQKSSGFPKKAAEADSRCATWPHGAPAHWPSLSLNRRKTATRQAGMSIPREQPVTTQGCVAPGAHPVVTGRLTSTARLACLGRGVWTGSESSSAFETQESQSQYSRVHVLECQTQRTMFRTQSFYRQPPTTESPHVFTHPKGCRFSVARSPWQCAGKLPGL